MWRPILSKLSAFIDDGSKYLLIEMSVVSQIYRSVINEEETRTGIQSSRPLNVTFNEALADKETCTLFIKRLLHYFDVFVHTSTQGTS